MDHIQEFKKYKTVLGYTESEAEVCDNEHVRLALKDVRGKATINEQVEIRLTSLLAYHNLEFFHDDEISRTAKSIIKLLKNHGKK